MNIHQLIPTTGRRDTSGKKQSAYHPLRSLQQDIDLMFDNFFQGFPSESTHSGLLTPHMDISETEKNYKVTLDIPGVDEKDLDISITGDTLSIRAEKQYENKEEGQRYHRVERSYGSYAKQLTLPSEVDADAISADYKNGVLTLDLPKKPEAQPVSKKIALKGKK